MQTRLRGPQAETNRVHHSQALDKLKTVKSRRSHKLQWRCCHSMTECEQEEHCRCLLIALCLRNTYSWWPDGMKSVATQIRQERADPETIHCQSGTRKSRHCGTRHSQGLWLTAETQSPDAPPVFNAVIVMAETDCHSGDTNSLFRGLCFSWISMFSESQMKTSRSIPTLSRLQPTIFVL
jgi:hypothetical protein